MQGLYQWQLTAQPISVITAQLRESNDYASVDQAHFKVLMQTVDGDRERLDTLIEQAVDRPLAQLDPVERSILWCGLAELTACPDVPFAVAINEAVELAKRFGAQDGHKYVNAVLDAVAKALN